MLFCESTSGWKYATAKPVTVLSKSNGGKVVALEFTFAKAIDAIKDNPTVLKMACAIAKALTLANNRCVDDFGGFCGSPSKYLPATPPVKAANTTATNATAAKNTTATNTTAAKTNTTTAAAKRILAANKTWSINLYINPDPTSATYDNAGWLDKVKGA